MCDSIANGGPRYVAAPCPPANVIIASNVLNTDGNVIAGNIIAVDGTFTGNLYVAGNLISNISYSTLNVTGTINAGSIVTGNISGNGAGLSGLNASNLSGSANLANLVVQNSVTTTNLTVNGSANLVNIVVQNSVTTTNLFVNGSANLTNLVVQNAVTTTNLFVNGSSNLTNLVVQNSVTTTNLLSTVSNTGTFNVSGTANISTLNVTTLTANSATIFGANTLNVFGISNLNSILGTSINVSGISNLNSIVTSLISGNGSGLSNLNSSNLVGNVANANVAMVVSQPAQPNITSVGTLTGLTVNGLLVATNGSAISNLNSSNLVGNVANANVALVVSQPAQPNITSIGTLTSLNVSGISNLNSVVTSLINGNGAGLFNITASNVLGTVGTAQSVINADQPNITSVGTLTSLSIIGSLIAGTISGDGAGITGIHPGSITGTVSTANAVVQPAQPNITSVGILTSLNVSGISNLNSIVTSLISGNASGLFNINASNLVGNVANANVALLVSQPAQPNITSIGTLTSLNVSGISNLNSIVSSLISGNGSAISNLNSSNLVGNVANANVALVVSQPVQPNITSVGTLTSLNVSGISNLNSIVTSLISGNASGLSNLTASNLSGTIPTGSLPTSGITAGLYGSGANVSSVTVDQYGRITAASNIAITASQWTSNTGNTIYYANYVGIGATFVPTANLHVVGNAYVSNSVTTTNIFFTNTIQDTNLPTSGVNAGAYGSSANVPQLTVDQYGRLTSASNVAFTALSQWTTVDGNVAYQNGVSIGTLSNPPVGSNLYVLGTANIGSINTSALSISNINLASANITSLFVATDNVVTSNITNLAVQNLANLVSANITTGNISTANLTTANIVTANVATANVTNLRVQTLANLVSANVTTGNIATANVTTANIVTANVATANVTNLTVRTLANLVSANVTTGNIATANVTTANATNLTVRTLANLVSANVTTGNIATANITSGNVVTANIVTLTCNQENVATLNVSSSFQISGVMNAVSQNTTFFYDTIILPYANITTTANIASLVVSGQSNLLTANLVTANVGTLNAVTAEFTSQMNALSANLVTANVGTLNAVTAGFTTQMNALSANLVTANIATANIGTENVVTLNAASIFTQNLNVAINSNVSNLVVTSNILAGPSGNTYITGNLVVSGNVFSNLGMPLGSGGGYYFSLSGDIALQTPYTGALYGATYPLSVGLSNGFTINGTSTLITVTTNGNFQFGVAGPYLLRAVFNSSDNITGLAVGSNIADQHGTDQNYMYRYTTFITQNPTELIEIPFNVTDVTKYYYLDLFSTDGGILRQTANTSGGTYLTITPLQGGGLATGGPGGTPGTQWINSGSNIYFSNSVGIGPINPQYNLDVIGNVHANSFISEVITGRTTAYTATPSDHYIGLSSGRSVTLPAGSVCPIGKMFIIKDEASNASVNSISLSTTDGDLIDGNSSVTLAINNISVTTLWTGTRWSLI